MKPDWSEARLREILSAHAPRRIEDEKLTEAAVLAPLFMKDGEWHLLFTRRSEKLPHHAGQISFPGGMRDPQDADLLAAALRESEEEMGIRPAHVRVLGRLDDLGTVTSFRISPFVGVIPYPYPFVPNPEEIAEVLEIPLPTLLDPAVFRKDTSGRHRGAPYTVYFFRCGKHTVWGATAKIVKQLLETAFGWREP